MGWRARSEPEQEQDCGREMMLWLLETYEGAGAHPEPAALVRVPQPSEPIAAPELVAAPDLVVVPETLAAPLQAVAVLERPIELVPEDLAPVHEPVPEDLAPVHEPVPEDLAPVHEPAPAPALFAERRQERRVECALAVAAAAPSQTADTAVGEAVDISRSGVHVVMDKVAVAGSIELIVADVIVDARVVGYRAIGEGRHSWHIHVIDADEAWHDLVASL